MLPHTFLFFVLLVISRCSAQVISPRSGLAEQTTSTSTISSSELSTEVETSFRTRTKTTKSRHSVTETEASTITSSTMTTHTKVNTHSSIPTTSSTVSLTSTVTIDSTTRPPQTYTEVVKPKKPKPTCCDFSKEEGSYTRLGPEVQIDMTCLHPKFKTFFNRMVSKDISQKQFCAQDTVKLSNTYKKVFRASCYAGDNPEEYRKDFAARATYHIECFSGFMESICGFHIITNTGFEIDSICGDDW